MRFYQKIRFRLTIGAVLLVAAVALLLTWSSQHLSKKVLQRQATLALIRETRLICLAMAAQTQMLSGDAKGLSTNQEFRTFRWVDLYNKGYLQMFRPRDDQFREAKPKAEAALARLLEGRDRYLQIEYYRDREQLDEEPILVCKRKGFSSLPAQPLKPDDQMIKRAKETLEDVSFSSVQVWQTKDGLKKNVVLQACFPVSSASENCPVGLMVVTLDFGPTVRGLTQSPRHVVFLAGEDGRILVYPQPDREPAYVLSAGEPISDECRRFTADWLTDEQELENDTSMNRSFPLWSRYAPGPPPAGREDDDWRPADFQFLMLRCHVGTGIRENPALREDLSRTLEDLKKKHPTLVFETMVKPTTDEVLIRGLTQDEQRIQEVQRALRERYGLGFLDPEPLRCARFLRTLYKFRLGRPEDKQSGEDKPGIEGRRWPEQCFYLGMASPLEPIIARIDDNQSTIFWTVVLCLLGAVALAVLGGRLLTRPLDVITKATQALAAGQPDASLPLRDQTEIGVLARSFAFMAGQIQERQRDIAIREARLQTILDSAAEAILTVGEDGTIRSFNRAAERLFGYSFSEIVDHHLSRLVEDPNLAANDAEAAERLAARLGQGRLGESTGRRKDGSTFPLEYGGNSVPLQERPLLTLILRDITWRKEAEEAARRRNEELARHVKERTRELEAANVELALARDKADQGAVAKDFFLATVSHELRTPLNHVTGFLQLLEMTELNDSQLRDLHKIQHAADNLRSLVDDLLDYQKMVQGVLTLEPTNFELAPWVADLADAMRPKIGERGNQLVVDCPADIGTLDADEKRARQALTNLLSNAAKFTRDGVITVRVCRERDGTNEWVRLDVRDTGRGMTPEQQAKLFQPFTKLLSRSENPEGTGLGLVLSQRLCRLMGGDLLLSHSEVAQGSTFTIRLPATPTAAPPASVPIRPPVLIGTPGAVRKPATVLVIDDDPEVRELMRRHLGGQGFTVHLAASGAEGLEMVKRVAPDAITLDVLMPGIDGWGTLAALQADAETAGIPVILITMLDDRTRGFALGAWEVLTKPVSWSRLIDLLRNLEPHTGPVLVVDDDPGFRELTERTLNQHGWEVCCVEDGQTALAAAARRRPALVLLDLLMPVMDGFEFLEAFRKDPVWREVPVVVLTAKDLTEEDYRRLHGSVLRILHKGMNSLEDLLLEVERLLHNHTTKGHPESDRADTAHQPA